MGDSKRTPLYQTHLDAGARMTDFAGWDMPLAYGSQIAEHQAVREAAGLFDVSHMTLIDIAGADALGFLRRLLAGDAIRLKAPGQAFYTTLLNEAGGIIDDLIAYRRPEGYRLIVNAAAGANVLRWLRSHEQGVLDIAERDLAMIAVQGPEAVAAFAEAARFPEARSLARFQAAWAGAWMVARTGYTGEDGLEIALPSEEVQTLWQRLVQAGVRPAGLAARDSLRLEAGLNLCGQDMDETTSPLSANLGWTVHWRPEDRNFIGRAALEAERAAGPRWKLTGLKLEAKGVMRAGHRVQTAAGEGKITSGGFSPALGCSIALARLPWAADGQAEVLVRGRRLPARILPPPFVRRGGGLAIDP